MHVNLDKILRYLQAHSPYSSHVPIYNWKWVVSYGRWYLQEKINWHLGTSWAALFNHPPYACSCSWPVLRRIDNLIPDGPTRAVFEYSFIEKTLHLSLIPAGSQHQALFWYHRTISIYQLSTDHYPSGMSCECGCIFDVTHCTSEKVNSLPMVFECYWVIRSLRFQTWHSFKLQKSYGFITIDRTRVLRGCSHSCHDDLSCTLRACYPCHKHCALQMSTRCVVSVHSRVTFPGHEHGNGVRAVLKSKHPTSLDCSFVTCAFPSSITSPVRVNL